jgi:hypothetical protein
MTIDQPQLSPDPPKSGAPLPPAPRRAAPAEEMRATPAPEMDAATPAAAAEATPTADPVSAAADAAAATTDAAAQVPAEPAGRTGKHAAPATPKAGRKRRGWFRRTSEPPAVEPAADPAEANPAEADPAVADPTKTDLSAASSAADSSDTPEPTVAGGRKKGKKLPSARPPGAPQDPWTAFATTPERKPGWLRRAIRAVGRGLIHEYAIVVYCSLALAVALTWPTLRYPMHTLPQDIYDPSRQAWQVAWAGHALLTDPALLWQSNTFFPADYSYAYSDSLLGYAPAGMLGEGPLAAVLRYNILYVLAHALLLIGGYALVRQLGTGRTGAAAAAVAFALAPWWLAQEGHLDIISAGGIPLALAMLARGHGWSMRHGFRAGRRHYGWAAAGWLVAAWQVSLGFSLGLPFAYVLGLVLVFLLIAVPIRWLRKKRPTLGWRLMITDVLGAMIVAGVGGLIAIPYLRSGGNGSAHAEIDFFSPPLRALLIAPAESRIWGAPHQVPRSTLGWPAEMTLLPGFVLYALALVGLVFSIWSWWQRLLLLVGLAATTILTLGSTFFDGRWSYFPLFGHLPDSFGVRIPGRLMVFVTLLLAILAGGAVAELVRRVEQFAAQRMPPWPSPWLRVATLIPLVLLVAESWSATAYPVVPAQPAAMRTVSTATLVLPSSTLSDETTMLWSTTRFQKIANGGGTSFAAVKQSQLRQAAATFPDQASISYLRGLGIDTVVLIRSAAVGTPWERAGDIPVDTLGIQREDLGDDAVLFRLN